MVGYVTVIFDRKEGAPLEKEIHLKKKKRRGSSTGAGQCGARDGEKGGKYVLSPLTMLKMSILKLAQLARECQSVLSFSAS